jgi:predicted PurR-regulated permease PerM
MSVIVTERNAKLEEAAEAPSVPLDETPAVPTAGEAAPPSMGERYRLFALAGLTFCCFVLCFLLAIPFLPAIAWGVALAIIAWPMHQWISARVKWPTVSALISTMIITTAIVGTGYFVASSLVQEGGNAVESAAQSPEKGVSETIKKVPGLSPVTERLETLGVNIEAEVRKFVESFTKDFSAVAQGSVASAVQFLAAVFLLFFLFRDRAAFLEGVMNLLPLTREETNRIMVRAADSVHANLYATFVTSLITTTAIGLMFWWLGLPSPMLWTVVMFFLSLLPVVGAGLVWLPAAVYLAMEGRLGAGILLVAWAMLFFVLVDTILYAKIAGPKMRMHETLTLLAFFGGLAFFGVSGMILGPAVLAITAAFVEVWKVRLTGVDPSPAIIGAEDAKAV